MAIISHKLIKSGQSFPFFYLLASRNPTVQISGDLSVKGYHSLFKPIILDYLQGQSRVCVFSLVLKPSKSVTIYCKRAHIMLAEQRLCKTSGTNEFMELENVLILQMCYKEHVCIF